MRRCPVELVGPAVSTLVHVLRAGMQHRAASARQAASAKPAELSSLAASTAWSVRELYSHCASEMQRVDTMSLLLTLDNALGASLRSSLSCAPRFLVMPLHAKMNDAGSRHRI
jgi:hypothetical protein